MNELRGKVWIILNFQHDEVKAFQWKDASVQDMWLIDNEDLMSHKLRRIEEHANSAIHGKRDELYLNFLSATGEYAWPKDVSLITNKTVFKFAGRLGIFVFDFPRRKAINHLIQQNKIYQANPGNLFNQAFFHGWDQTVIVLIIQKILNKISKKIKNFLRREKIEEKLLLQITQNRHLIKENFEEIMKNIFQSRNNLNKSNFYNQNFRLAIRLCEN